MTVNVQCVYGSDSVDHINECLIPNLQLATSQQVVFYGMNYEPNGRQITQGRLHNIEVINIKNNNKLNTGFAENHNRIFMESEKTDCFILINPDCIPLPNSIDRLIYRKTQKNIAIVEGRQWPFEHWKIYDTNTMETPWASGAFQLIDSDFYQSVNGMDPIYFLYCEDVDLSWRAWLHGYNVIYEPGAQVIHFTNGSFHRDDIISNETYYTYRNFLILARKFFGEKKERWAMDLVRKRAPLCIVNKVLDDYSKIRASIDTRYSGKVHKYINIYGISQYAKPKGE